jgi:predicted TIM-barrel fold metal-dependent hydrolase
VEAYGDATRVHLVHFGGGMSGHIKLIGHRFFDWIESGKQVYTDLSWAIGFAPRWLAAEIESRGIGHDRVLFASDEPWGDHAAEYTRLEKAAADSHLKDLAFRGNFDRLYG